MAFLPPASDSRCALGLDADDFHLRPQALGDEADAARAAASTDGHKNYIRVPEVVQNFKPHRPDPGNESQLVRGMDIAQTFGRRDALYSSRAWSKRLLPGISLRFRTT